MNSRCILSKFYIKPQRSDVNSVSFASCILSKFYIKPQPKICKSGMSSSCILSKFYIKPQLSRMYSNLVKVVSYRNSTSNHNDPSRLISSAFVVSYRNSTSNHNFSYIIDITKVLYLIEILHQTTTLAIKLLLPGCCILSKFYIKPQLHSELLPCFRGCILSKFYIKPQRGRYALLYRCRCILSKFYIKPQPRPQHQ